MRNNLIFTGLVIVFMLGVSSLKAQFIVKDAYFNPTGVSNQGMVAGYSAQAGPYTLWNPDDNTTTDIGGAAPGLGVGGLANFSADGISISGTNYDITILNPQWERDVLNGFSYIFTDIEFLPYQSSVGFAGGQSVTYNGNGIIMKTDDEGETWYPVWTDNNNHGIETMSFPSEYAGYAAGWNGYFAKTTDGGTTWTTSTPGGSDVYIYKSMAFKDDYNGVLAAQTNDGSAVYVTDNGGTTWSVGSGLASIPNKVTYVYFDTWFLVTNGGEIQKSTNNGLTWTTVFDAPDMLLGIGFRDEMTGIATGETYYYMTTDGGNTWTMHEVISGVTSGVLWRDVAWTPEGTIILTGTPDMICESSDGGATWTFANETIYNGNPGLYDIAISGVNAHICGSQGNFYKKSLINSISAGEMAVYNTIDGEWTFLGSLGFSVENHRSSGFNISSDGSTIVGNAWADPANGNGTTSYTHAVAWNAAEGLIDLGSLYASINRSTRAEAVSGDGETVVGWQDFNGPWKAAMWKKNPAGGYFPNQYLLIDPQGDSLDEFNQLGWAHVISADGVWIGGDGDYANNGEPWLWSEATGYKPLGKIVEGQGNVTGINHNGTVVTGWFDMGMWDPAVPFIWTEKQGMMNLNSYITDTLGFTMQNSPVYVPNGISYNGDYITGWGYDFNIGAWGDYFTFRLDLTSVNNSKDVVIDHVSVYPNPAKDYITINTPGIVENVKIYDMSGILVMDVNGVSKSRKIDISSLVNGTYVGRVVCENSVLTFKVIKK